jgi:DNA-directed RNA polymerase sigma subunit (sigma70/sigma32)
LDTFIVNEPDYAWVDELESGIEGLLKLLKERNRTILMRYVDGDTVNNIALNYGLTRSRVDMIIADARRRLWFHPEKSKVIAEWVEAQRQPPRRIQNELERMGEARARNILRLEAHTEKFD